MSTGGGGTTDTNIMYVMGVKVDPKLVSDLNEFESKVRSKYDRIAKTESDVFRFMRENEADRMRMAEARVKKEEIATEQRLKGTEQIKAGTEGMIRSMILLQLATKDQTEYFLRMGAAATSAFGTIKSVSDLTQGAANLAGIKQGTSAFGPTVTSKSLANLFYRTNNVSATTAHNAATAPISLIVTAVISALAGSLAIKQMYEDVAKHGFARGSKPGSWGDQVGQYVAGSEGLSFLTNLASGGAAGVELRNAGLLEEGDARNTRSRAALRLQVSGGQAGGLQRRYDYEDTSARIHAGRMSSAEYAALQDSNNKSRDRAEAWVPTFTEIKTPFREERWGEWSSTYERLKKEHEATRTLIPNLSPDRAEVRLPQLQLQLQELQRREGGHGDNLNSTNSREADLYTNAYGLRSSTMQGFGAGSAGSQRSIDRRYQRVMSNIGQARRQDILKVMPHATAEDRDQMEERLKQLGEGRGGFTASRHAEATRTLAERQAKAFEAQSEAQKNLRTSTDNLADEIRKLTREIEGRKNAVAPDANDQGSNQYRGRAYRNAPLGASETAIG